MNNIFLNEQRCNCGKLLLKGIFLDATLEIKCKKCGAMNRVDNFYFDIDKEGIIKYISPSVEKVYKFPQEIVFGKNYFECAPIGDRAECKKNFKYFSENEKAYRMKDTACLSTNGETIFSELFFTPNFNEAGKFVGYRVVAWVTKKVISLWITFILVSGTLV
ncbi:MAG: Com family DNA-binding transcriptional regulator [Candidatus Paceibacterota bacterium]|jgi:PAS domain S-box-containing protein